MSKLDRSDIELMALQVVVTAIAKRFEGNNEFMDDAMHHLKLLQEDLETRAEKELLNIEVQTLISG
ncbi:hypothetical protein ACLB90_18455 [Stenotrophomonas sp. LGBM10]|uniref:hypothetical protein n=1 Tax=Stenotrophomonas sp. LGBM10 TaxID=3390038 RepID=UPI00398A7816